MKELEQSISSRRKFLSMSGAGLLMVPSLAKAMSLDTLTGGVCAEIPSETEGPYPGHSDDRGVNVLKEAGVIRKDITESLATSNYPGASVAEGLPLNFNIKLVNAKDNCSPLEGYAIYVWHCDKDGLYSMYNDPIKEDTYLRGVQVTNGKGEVSFNSIFPGCYDGRMVHIHFEIFKNITLAVNNENITKISQFGFPRATCEAVYKAWPDIYTESTDNLSRISFDSDNVFGDGYDLQVANIESGTEMSGLVSSITVAIDPDSMAQSGGGMGGPGMPPPGGKPPGMPPSSKS